VVITVDTAAGTTLGGFRGRIGLNGSAGERRRIRLSGSIRRTDAFTCGGACELSTGDEITDAWALEAVVARDRRRGLVVHHPTVWWPPMPATEPASSAQASVYFISCGEFACATASECIGAGEYFRSGESGGAHQRSRSIQCGLENSERCARSCIDRDTTQFAGLFRIRSKAARLQRHRLLPWKLLLSNRKKPALGNVHLAAPKVTFEAEHAERRS